MKRILLLFVVTLVTGLSANAQCTPDPQYTEPGVYPDSATGFDPATVLVPYEQLITNVVPEDTTTTIGGFPVTLTFDSVIIVSVTGLPPGYSYSCYDAQNMISPPDGCCFEGNTIGCVSIVGTSQLGEEGSYPLNIEVEAYLEGGSSPAATYDIDYYTIEVGSASIDEYLNSKFKIYPNPVVESFTLDGLDGLDVSSISISNSEGKVLRSYADINSSSFDMNVANLEGGIYFVRIAHGTSMNVVRFIKE